jgi:hypothetical protein
MIGMIGMIGMIEYTWCFHFLFLAKELYKEVP